jgi:adenylate cyclase
MFAAAAAILLYRWWTQGRHRRGMLAALGVHFPPTVARRLANVPDRLTPAGEQREISCLSLGLKNFAAIRERLDPQEVVALLNSYLGCMSDVLLRHEATIDAFHGDTILAFFGAPGLQIDHARRAAAAALECRAELRQLARELAGTDTPSLSLRVGLATGPAIVGNCGPAQRFDYNAIGPAVDLAGRVLDVNGLLGTSILVSSATAAELEPTFLLRPLGRVVVADNLEPMALFELLGRLADSSDELRCWADGFGAAIDLFARREFAPAAAAFEALNGKKSPRRDDRPAALYLARCRDAIAHPPGNEWSAAIRGG